MAEDMFCQRRQELFQRMKSNSIAILPAAIEQVRNGEHHFPFRQNSDFYYLTGFIEPEAIAVFLKGQSTCKYILFNRSHDSQREIFYGHFVGQEGAIKDFGANQSYPISEIDSKLPELLKGEKHLYIPFGRYRHFDHQMLFWINVVRRGIRLAINAPYEITNIETLIHDMRLIKGEVEISLIKKSVDIASGAHRKVMQLCKPGLFEYELEAELLREFYRQGARAVAYDSIVAGGAHACVLHYSTNNDQLHDGDLVLVDAGCEYGYYSSDISRTFPVNGKFNPQQRAIYEIVLEAQLAAIDEVRPGKRWNQNQQKAVEIITEGLCRLGLLKGNLDRLMEEEAYKPFYMHRIGHWLGIDAHDVGMYQVDDQWRMLQPGMVMTIEPGIYISPGNKNIDKKWWGIGVRIEDDVLITDAGNHVLSADVPKAIDEIESIVGTF